jgi:hypothetical protein
MFSNLMEKNISLIPKFKIMEGNATALCYMYVMYVLITSGKRKMYMIMGREGCENPEKFHNS